MRVWGTTQKQKSLNIIKNSIEGTYKQWPQRELQWNADHTDYGCNAGRLLPLLCSVVSAFPFMSNLQKGMTLLEEVRLPTTYCKFLYFIVEKGQNEVLLTITVKSWQVFQTSVNRRALLSFQSNGAMGKALSLIVSQVPPLLFISYVCGSAITWFLFTITVYHSQHCPFIFFYFFSLATDLCWYFQVKFNFQYAISHTPL